LDIIFLRPEKIVKIPNDLVIYIKKPPISYTFYTKRKEKATFFSNSIAVFAGISEKNYKNFIFVSGQ